MSIRFIVSSFTFDLVAFIICALSDLMDIAKSVVVERISNVEL